MCGIAGVLSRSGSPASLEQLRRMCGALHHRGPDEFGAYRDAHAGLAHARLSIVDLATGQQPLANEDETLWIVFNGEIFNYVELRAELEAKGHAFRTRSDTEVIVHAYEEWGDDAFRRFNGQWAIALWDSTRKELVLSRDPVGICPLYFCEHEGRVYFASEIKAIFAGDPSVPREIDPVGLEQTFTFWSVVPPQSVFRGIRELEPGHVRRYAASGAIHQEAYWENKYPKDASETFQGSLEDAVVAVRDALERATRLRMLRADVPVGTYLSGGLDSSLVTALSLRAKGEKFHTYSIRFEDAEYDESAHQETMVEYLGTEHHHVICKRADIADVFPRVVAHAERPVLRAAAAPLYLLSRLAREGGTKVVLTGEGADEMFAGYDLFREAKVRRFMARAPASAWRPLLLDRLYPYLARSPVSQRAIARKFFGSGLDRWREPGFSHAARWNTAGALKRLFTPQIRERAGERDVVADLVASLPADFSSWTFLAQDQYLEMRTLLSGYLLSSQGDRMLMANSVEGRFPFLDKDVIALASSLPPSYKLKVLDEKHVLKRASEGLVHPSIVRRPKQPYRAPDALAFVGDGAPAWVLDVVSEGAVARAGIFEPASVRALWMKCRARSGEAQLSNTDNMAIVGVLSTQLLHALLVEAPPRAREVTLATLVDRLR